ncbi:MAG: hypothetical protein K0M78_01305, partial [Brevundimonas sp.]|nr:hypothetical protein [Brevundimonas sp.]
MSLALVAAPASADDPAAARSAPVAAAAEAAVAPARPSRERTRMNQRVFDRVWSEVRGQYYDPDLHGVDWNAARRTYRPRALAAADDRALYRALGDMLALLDDDHAGASAPAVARPLGIVRPPPPPHRPPPTPPARKIWPPPPPPTPDTTPPKPPPPPQIKKTRGPKKTP